MYYTMSWLPFKGGVHVTEISHFLYWYWLACMVYVIL